ncbi:hypothetical protein P9847_05320 [Paenibacillus chibensis]|uniref:Uncharacterized protein n=1 Tax=Paenibacillus chibensis TaxID=59846 RepID=A0ABU6PPC6_9BACL|nr:hypothetical protein [Paenibacillus chibensis]
MDPKESEGGGTRIKKYILQALVCLLCSPLIFVAMYLDYYDQYTFFYFIVILFPLLFIRKHAFLILLFLLSSIGSSLLVHMCMPADTGTFFTPFGQYLTVLVILEAFFFGIIQAVLLLFINIVKQWLKGLASDR